MARASVCADANSRRVMEELAAAVCWLEPSQPLPAETIWTSSL